MYILDTNVISELRKANTNKACPNVVAWAQGINTNELFVSVITMMELELGIASLERKDATQARMLRAWFENQVLPGFSSRTLVVDTEIALRCAHLHIPDKRSERDTLIAATALIHSMTVVTRNVNDFKHTGVQIINPWQVQPGQ